MMLMSLSFIGIAQTRLESPNLEIPEEPLAQLGEGVTGWSYSLDGKWISGENRIYKRIHSSQIEELEEDPNQLGIDNFEDISTYEFTYGEDTLLLIVKSFLDGRYEYPRSKRGWKDWRSVHYFVIEKPKSQWKDITDTTFREFRFRLRASGTVRKVSRRRTMERIIPRINLNQTSKRFLILQTEVYPATSTIRFMLYSNHSVFQDVRGILSDLTLRGNSLFGSQRLLDYAYFECDLTRFVQLEIL